MFQKPPEKPNPNEFPDTGGSDLRHYTQQLEVEEFSPQELKVAKDEAYYLFTGIKVELQKIQAKYPDKRYFSAIQGNRREQSEYQEVKLSKSDEGMVCELNIDDLVVTNDEKKLSTTHLTIHLKKPETNQGMINLKFRHQNQDFDFHFNNLTDLQTPIIQGNKGVMRHLERVIKRAGAVIVFLMEHLEEQDQFTLSENPPHILGLKGSSNARDKGHLN